LVLAHRCFSHIRFAILVDILSPDLLGSYPSAVKAACHVNGAQLVYLNTNLPRLAATRGLRFARGVAVPGIVNPRPVELLYLPRADATLRQELFQAPLLTADWMGF
jgi:hypothetical protein